MIGPRYTYKRYLDDAHAQAAARREGKVPARDPWCITALLRIGEITAGQHGAAVRLSALMERGHGVATAGLERIDRSGGDPHARMFDMTLCGQEAENALAYVRTHLAGSPRSVAALDAALSFPHRSVAAAQRDAGFGYGGKRDRDRFVSCLVEALERLIAYWNSVDAQAERERRRAH